MADEVEQGDGLQVGPDDQNQNLDQAGVAESTRGTEGTPAIGSPADNQTTTPEPPQYSSVRDYAERALGLQGASQQFSDDFAFMQHVGQGLQRSQQLEATLRQRDQQLAWLQAQQQQFEQARQQQQEPEDPRKKVYNPPPYDPAWERMVRQDENGNLTVLPGYDPSIAQKYLAHHEYRRQWLDRMLSNPTEALQPFIEHHASKLVDERVRAAMEQQQSGSFVNQFLKENSDWLLQQDEQGQAVFDPATGRQMLSPAGRRFKQYVDELGAMGVTDPQMQAHIARMATQRDLLADYWQQGEANVQNEQQKKQVKQQANRRPNQEGSLLQQQRRPQEATNGEGEPRPSLRELMLKAMADHGITDEVIAREL